MRYYGPKIIDELKHKILSHKKLILKEELKDAYSFIVSEIYEEFSDRLKKEFGIAEFDLHGLDLSYFISGLKINNTREFLTLCAISDLTASDNLLCLDIDCFEDWLEDSLSDGDFNSKNTWYLYDMGMGSELNIYSEETLLPKRSSTGYKRDEDYEKMIKERIEPIKELEGKTVDDFFELLIEMQEKYNEMYNLAKTFKNKK